MIIPQPTTVDAIELIQQEFESYWKVQPLTCAVVWDGLGIQTFSKTATPVTVASGYDYKGEGFVEVRIVHTSSAQVAVGRHKYDHLGKVVVGVFAEPGRGRLRRGPGLLADQVLNYFETANGSIAYRASILNEAGNVGKWAKINVISDFLYTVNRHTH